MGQAGETTMLGRCVICGQAVMGHETGIFFGGLTVARDAFSRWENYDFVGHENCAAEIVRRLGLRPEDADRRFPIPTSMMQGYPEGGPGGLVS